MSGTFLQPALADTWTDTQWNTEFQNMSNASITQLVLQWSADSKNKTTVYPTTALAGFTQNTTTDVVAKVLTKGNTYGKDIYLGLVLNEDWFVKYANDQAWLDNEEAIVKNLATDLYNKYGSYASFKGWYLSFEVDNWNFPTSVEWNRMKVYYNDVITHIKAMTPTKPVMISPFFNTKGGLTTTQWTTMWEYILTGSSIDIIALQDGVGADHAITSQLAVWFAATKTAITNARPATLLWADTETFNLDFKPMEIKMIVDDMLAVQPSVTNYLSFSYNHYMSPQQVNSLYHTTYVNYLQNNSVESIAPSIPTGLTGTVVNSSSINLAWTVSTDNFGVVGYRIYRNDELVWTQYTNTPSFSDIQLNGGTTYLYKVQAFDAAGNLSAITANISKTTTVATVYPTNLATGKTYTTTMIADPLYPDSGGELTNGAFGTAVYQDAAWQGRNSGSVFSFTMDLGSTQTIKELSTNVLQVKSVYILLPSKITYSVSTNGSTFTQVGIVNLPAVSSMDQTKKYKLTDLTSISGRYVKVEITPKSSAWTFLDEIEVRQ